MGEKLEINLTIDRAAEPLAGSVRAGDESPREFQGWTGLIAAIDAARALASREGTVAADGEKEDK